jgi:hypothetical protein
MVFIQVANHPFKTCVRIFRFMSSNGKDTIILSPTIRKVRIIPTYSSLVEHDLWLARQSMVIVLMHFTTKDKAISAHAYD